jgi:membrane protein
MSPIALWNAVDQGVRHRWRALKQSRPALTHAADAYQHYKDNQGDLLAAAITYFSFLALFPLIFLGVAVAGFIMKAHPSLKADLLAAIHRNVPGDFGNTVATAVETAIRSRTSVGVIALVGIALAGLGWVANLRRAIDGVWGCKPVERNFFLAKALDALVLVGLGLGVMISLGLSFVGTYASHQVIDWLGWANSGAVSLATKVLGLALAILGDMLVFGWLLVRLPQVEVPRRIAIQTTLLASIGFEVLKLIGGFYLSRIAHSPTAVALGTVVGVLIFIDLVSRYLLYCVAWAAVAVRAAEAKAAEVRTDGSLGLERQTAVVERGVEAVPESPTVPPVAVAAGLFSAGVAVGAGSAGVLQRRRRRAQQRRESRQ